MISIWNALSNGQKRWKSGNKVHTIDLKVRTLPLSVTSQEISDFNFKRVVVLTRRWTTDLDRILEWARVAQVFAIKWPSFGSKRLIGAFKVEGRDFDRWNSWNCDSCSINRGVITRGPFKTSKSIQNRVAYSDCTLFTSSGYLQNARNIEQNIRMRKFKKEKLGSSSQKYLQFD